VGSVAFSLLTLWGGARAFVRYLWWFVGGGKGVGLGLWVVFAVSVRGSPEQFGVLSRSP